MRNIAIKLDQNQEKSFKNTQDINLDDFPKGPELFDMLEEELRYIVRLTLISTIHHEFEDFIGVAPYQRSDSRTNYRNGMRYRNFETRFGVIENIPIPRARHQSFFPKIFSRWSRRENKIVRAIAEMFINGISTRRVKKITKAIWGQQYSASTVSRCNQVLQHEYMQWMNRPVTHKIRYLFLDAINLKIRRHW